MEEAKLTEKIASGIPIVLFRLEYLAIQPSILTGFLDLSTGMETITRPFGLAILEFVNRFHIHVGGRGKPTSSHPDEAH